jgi:DNA repair protein RadC
MNKKNAFSDLFPLSFDRQQQKASLPENQALTLSSDKKAAQPKENSETPHYHGHRDRLRERFLAGDTKALPDYEIIELLLFLGIPRKDVKPLAKSLLQKYDNLASLMAAEPKELLEFKDMTKNAVCALKIVKEAASRMMRQDLIGKPILNSWERLTDYLYATMAQEKKEHFRILLLDRKNNLIADEVQQTGTVDQTQAYPREILKRTLELSATAIILVHNHPSGDPSPSSADLQMTKNIVEAAKALEITVHDHVIVSKKGLLSFRKEGLLDF